MENPLNLFQLGSFTLNSEVKSPFKIDCDALTFKDWYTLAWLAYSILPPFSKVEGVPRGGLLFAKALEAYAVKGDEPGGLLIVDDVLTTGGSMERHRAGRSAYGCVVFARGPHPQWIRSLFTVNSNEL